MPTAALRLRPNASCTSSLTRITNIRSTTPSLRPMVSGPSITPMARRLSRRPRPSSASWRLTSSMTRTSRGTLKPESWRTRRDSRNISWASRPSWRADTSSAGSPVISLTDITLYYLQPSIRKGELIIPADSWEVGIISCKGVLI